MKRYAARTRYLSPEEEAQLLSALPAGIKRDAVAFLMDTGARVNEAPTLTWDDLKHHPKLDRVTFFRTKTMIPLANTSGLVRS